MNIKNLHGTQIYLSKIVPHDLDFISELECDASLWAFEEHVESDREAVRNKYEQQADSKHHHDFVIRLNNSPNHPPIGLMQIWSYSEHRRSWELGYAILPAYQGKGYGREAAHLMLDFAFNTLGAHKVVGMCHSDNLSSSRLMASIGMKRQGIFRQELWLHEKWHDQWFYEVTEADRRSVNEAHTQKTLLDDLRRIGIKPGMTVIVHASFRAIGQVIGGAESVIAALQQAVGSSGNLVMPTQTEQLCEPDEYDSDLTAEDVARIKDLIPLYDPALTPTAYMGWIAETFRQQTDVQRSAHPHMSFAAWGADAAQITDSHPLDYALSETSPLGRLYERQAQILLLGAPADSNTSLHLAEYQQRNSFVQPKRWGVKMQIDGDWATYADINNDSDDFGQIFEDFQTDTLLVREGRIGAATSFLMPQREMVDYALEWMNQYRK